MTTQCLYTNLWLLWSNKTYLKAVSGIKYTHI